MSQRRRLRTPDAVKALGAGNAWGHDAHVPPTCLFKVCCGLQLPDRPHHLRDHPAQAERRSWKTQEAMMCISSCPVLLSVTTTRTDSMTLFRAQPCKR